MSKFIGTCYELYAQAINKRKIAKDNIDPLIYALLSNKSRPDYRVCARYLEYQSIAIELMMKALIIAEEKKPEFTHNIKNLAVLLGLKFDNDLIFNKIKLWIIDQKYCNIQGLNYYLEDSKWYGFGSHIAIDSLKFNFTKFLDDYLEVEKLWKELDLKSKASNLATDKVLVFIDKTLIEKETIERLIETIINFDGPINDKDFWIEENSNKSEFDWVNEKIAEIKRRKEFVKTKNDKLKMKEKLVFGATLQCY